MAALEIASSGPILNLPQSLDHPVGEWRILLVISDSHLRLIFREARRDWLSITDALYDVEGVLGWTGASAGLTANYRISH